LFTHSLAALAVVWRRTVSAALCKGTCDLGKTLAYSYLRSEVVNNLLATSACKHWIITP